MEKKTMPVKMIYEKVCLRVAVEQRIFFNWLNDTVEELLALYPEKYILVNGAEWERIWSLDDEISVRALYVNGIIDNILYLLGADENLKSEFLRKSNNAYKRYRKEDDGVKFIKRMRW